MSRADRELRRFRLEMVKVHGARKALKAEALALLILVEAVWLAAVARRERAERVYHAAVAEASEMPEGWREQNKLRPWPSRWGPYVWNALERFAEAGRVEAEWSQRFTEAAEAIGAWEGEAERAECRSAWRGGWTEVRK